MGNNINDSLQGFFKKSLINEIKIELTFSTPSKDINVKTTSLDVEGDYVHKFGDSITAVFRMLKGDLIYDIIPFRDDLNMTIKLTENGITKTRLMMAILDQLPTQLEDPSYRRESRVALNKSFIDVQVHLLDIPLLALRSSATNGIYVNKNLEETIISVFKKDAVDVSSLALYPPIDLKFAKPDNKRVYDHINLGVEKKVLGLPLYLQEDYGIYNAGLNAYKPTFEGLMIDKHTLHIYPPYVRPKINKVILYVMNDPMMKATDNTYYVKDEVHHIAVDMSNPIDLDSSKYYSDGVNKTYMSPEQPIYNKTTQDQKKKVLSYTHKNTITKKKNKTVLQDLLVPFSDMSHTDNPYKLASSVVNKEYTIVQLSWSGALLTIFEPCMACILISDGVQRECHLLHTHYSHIDNRGSTAILTVAIKKKSSVGGGTNGTTVTQIL